MEISEAQKARVLNKTTAPQKGEARSAWEVELDRFDARINPPRMTAGYKPYSHSRIAKLLTQSGVCDAGSAFAFYKKLDTEAKNFGKLFDHLTNPKKRKV